MSPQSPARPADGAVDLDAWLRWLETLSPTEIVLGLERVQAVLARLALPRPARVVHVAGTNGKGSTAAMLEALYRETGATVGCYTSPHVLRFNERMRVQGRPLPDADIVAAFERVDAARGDVPLTYFEFGTLAALVAFAAAGAGVLVLEIGLGGRLDAVNAIDPDGAIITNISLDHCDWLGSDIESIAREKAGVMRGGIPVVFGAPSVPAAIAATAAERGARLMLAGRDFRAVQAGEGWRFESAAVVLDGLRPPSLGGAFQRQNAAAALALFIALEGPDRLTGAAVDAAFGSLALPGRLQRLATSHDWLLDVAHNPGAAAVLADWLREHPPRGRVTAVFGALADKDLNGMLQPLAGVVQRWIAVPADSPRAAGAVTLGARIAGVTGRPCRIADGIADGLAMAAAHAGGDDLLLVTGSFYTVGPALAVLLGPGVGAASVGTDSAAADSAAGDSAGADSVTTDTVTTDSVGAASSRDQGPVAAGSRSYEG
ncbi:MAG: bifunctional tetrahydrofolate synthase/dihydrofolate synthase [Woeseiaceae bacterium]|nr:bifunctional tetrahydrofolate synthase/dihydrofolate synthase [Woeseiaceae bacterium]